MFYYAKSSKPNLFQIFFLEFCPVMVVWKDCIVIVDQSRDDGNDFFDVALLGYRTGTLTPVETMISLIIMHYTLIYCYLQNGLNYNSNF